MIAHRIGFAAWLFVSSFCPALNASAHLSCENVEAPLIGDDVLGNGNRCAEIISPQGTLETQAASASSLTSDPGSSMATRLDPPRNLNQDAALAASHPSSVNYIRSEPAPSTQSAPCCREERTAGKFPHPYVVGSLSFNGSGYSPLSEILGAGISLDLHRMVADAELSYDNVRKTNDNTGYNPKGRERGAQSRVFYKLNNGLYFGLGAQWSQLSTSHYSKQAWRPTIGVGKDFLRETHSLRVQAMYITAGTDRANGVQGPEVNITYPSPATSGHLFWRTTWSVYRFHTTDTFSDPATSALQRADHHFTGGTASGLIWRF